MTPQNRLLGWLFGKVVPFLDFFLLEVLLAKRGIVALVVSAGVCLGLWFFRTSLETLKVPLTVWGLPLELWAFVALTILLAAFFAAHKWFSYGRGPKNATYDVVFAGFYDPSGPEGNFVRSGASKGLEAEFLRTMRQALDGHHINSDVQIESAAEKVDLPLRVVDYRPPRGFYAVRDFEGFDVLARKFASRCIGVVWGTVDKDGRVERFEIIVNPIRYHGRRMVDQQFDRVRHIVDQNDLPSPVVIRYLGRVLAALWGASYCQMLNDLDRNIESLSIAADSRRLVEGALEELREAGGPDTATMAESQKRALLPPLLRQEAWSLLLDGQVIRALERLLLALKADVYWPLANSREFADYYNNDYAFDLQRRTDIFRELFAEQQEENASEQVGHLDSLTPRYITRALADLPPPNLPLFVGWIELALVKGENPENRIEEWFSELIRAYPGNAFVLLHWGDAIKLLAGPRERWYSRPSLDKVDAAMKKYEAAYQLDSSLSVVAVRLSTLYIVTAAFFRGTNEGERRLQEGRKWLERAELYYEEYMPHVLAQDTLDEE